MEDGPLSPSFLTLSSTPNIVVISKLEQIVNTRMWGQEINTNSVVASRTSPFLLKKKDKW